MSEELHAGWATARAQLSKARELLTNDTDTALRAYEEFLDHNELGLALDALVDVAADQRAPRIVWEALAEAAAALRIEPSDSVHGDDTAQDHGSACGGP